MMCKGHWDKGIRQQVKSTRSGIPEEFPEMINDISIFILPNLYLDWPHMWIFDDQQRNVKTKNFKMILILIFV